MMLRKEGDDTAKPEESSIPSSGPARWKSSASAAGERLDVYIARVFETSRNQVARWISEGRVTVANREAKPGLKLDGEEWISCEPKVVSQEGRVDPEEGDLRVIYEAEDLVVLDKPPDLVMHPGAGRPAGTLANRLLAAYPEMASVGGAGRPGIVHRLDRGTSGVVVTARTAEAYLALTEAFATRRVGKTYLAIAFGAPKEAEGTISAPIGRHALRRKEMAVASQGRPAETVFRALASHSGLTLFELRPVTGRTHQIRVHLKHAGHPIVGDPVYGEARWKDLARIVQTAARDFPRPALHAWKLALPESVNGTAREFSAPLPDDMRELWLECTGTDLPAAVCAD